MNKAEWVEGFRVPWKSKIAFCLLSFFAIVGFGFVGYKMDSWVLVLLATVLVIAFLDGAFYRTQFHVDADGKRIIKQSRFYFTWTQSYSYQNACLRRDGGTISSPTFQQCHTTGTFDIFLSTNGNKRGELLFSSNKGEDYSRVMDFLSKYIPACNY
ncbi:hypothetical protein [Microbulbifer sediminum]|uniref:hypothetical protein n=1 Tax=Microbulbifer sediminum TaxID=2904250 RepID=UPI001F1C6090|nr:hypothetical protein [Microbulbifer sediminum]